MNNVELCNLSICDAYKIVHHKPLLDVVERHAHAKKQGLSRINTVSKATI